MELNSFSRFFNFDNNKSILKWMSLISKFNNFERKFFLRVSYFRFILMSLIVILHRKLYMWGGTKSQDRHLMRKRRCCFTWQILSLYLIQSLRCPLHVSPKFIDIVSKKLYFPFEHIFSVSV